MSVTLATTVYTMIAVLENKWCYGIVHIPPLAAHSMLSALGRVTKKDKGQLSRLTVFAPTMFALV